MAESEPKGVSLRKHDEIENWLREAREGEASWSTLAERILQLEHAPSGEHRPDTDRQRRCGFPEVIFGSGKSPQDIATIARTLLDHAGSLPAEFRNPEVLVTRVMEACHTEVAGHFEFTRYDAVGRTLRLSDTAIAKINRAPCPSPLDVGSVVVVTAGSTDLPVAREALETLRWMGVDAGLLTDVGVAGPYRLLPHLDRLRQATVLVVVAGMEGALASVLGGLVACPVIAVPTSVGYGACFEGITTLLSMMSSCAAGVTVVNIDAGFKGGYVAGLIATRPNALGLSTGSS